MKKFCITFFGSIIILLTAFFAVTLPKTESNAEYLRIHIRANSNSEIDQAVKYKVKDEVVTFLTPYIAQSVDKDSAYAIVSDLLPEIENVCDSTLKRNGFSYGSHASLRQEQFPTRVYDDVTLYEGVYDALIVELGEGVGDNWWCVIYPPLCFTSAGGNVQYQSLIYDIITKFFNK
jgi:stage II sporulation protein R